MEIDETIQFQNSKADVLTLRLQEICSTFLSIDQGIAFSAILIIHRGTKLTAQRSVGCQLQVTAGCQLAGILCSIYAGQQRQAVWGPSRQSST